MIVARERKKENIAEYLLYMWQIEELIRGFKLDIDEIEKNVISKYAQPYEVKDEVRTWYKELIDMMYTEGKVERGHLQINTNVIIELNDLHLQLLKSTKIANYAPIFHNTLPYIAELKAKRGSDAEYNDIEICFTALYGVLMLKLSGREVSEGTAEAAWQITKLLATLSDLYKKDKSFELEI